MGYNYLMINDAESEKIISYDYNNDGLKNKDCWRKKKPKAGFLVSPNKFIVTGGALVNPSRARVDWVEAAPSPGLCAAVHYQVEGEIAECDTATDQRSLGKLIACEERQTSGGDGAVGTVAVYVSCDLQLEVCPPLEIVSSSGYHSTPAMEGLRSSMDGDVDVEAVVHCLVPRKNAAGPKVGPVIDGDDAPVDGLTLNGVGVDKGSIRAGSARDISVENPGNSDGKDLEREEQMLENRKT
ncbi:hypothetical protein AHAS_Ahas19G0144700 [Arachis hypogaea]